MEELKLNHYILWMFPTLSPAYAYLDCILLPCLAFISLMLLALANTANVVAFKLPALWTSKYCIFFTLVQRHLFSFHKKIIASFVAQFYFVLFHDYVYVFEIHVYLGQYIHFCSQKNLSEVEFKVCSVT